ncbi:hypothetical protein AAL_06238 [Moelleriella libera RCEF 2490]|uniref:Uncharacterized protein n=1 Tax=Moelleriella libera RCEF 2490 TaxID=1081109 RepID=A0A167Z1E0_9HYPO|nr:hypothetical protein AAL_06238 [Moelleriella libera RCEF 2490]
MIVQKDAFVQTQIAAIEQLIQSRVLLSQQLKRYKEQIQARIKALSRYLEIEHQCRTLVSELAFDLGKANALENVRNLLKTLGTDAKETPVRTPTKPATKTQRKYRKKKPLH